MTAGLPREREPCHSSGIYLFALWRQFWHCLFHLHRMLKAWDGGMPMYLGCDCGVDFWYRHEGARDYYRHAFATHPKKRGQ